MRCSSLKQTTMADTAGLEFAISLRIENTIGDQTQYAVHVKLGGIELSVLTGLRIFEHLSKSVAEL
jgi:hypothetical protein